MRPFRVLPLLSLAALVACGGDGPTSQITIPIPPVDSAGRDVDLDSLFGAATPQVLAVINAQRAELDRAADAALAGEVAIAADGGLALDVAAVGAFTPIAAAPRTAAAVQAGPQPFPIHFRDSKTEQVGPANNTSTVTTTKTLDATLENGTLTVVSTDRYVARANQMPDATHPSSSLVSETRRELVVSACPDAAGVGAGRWKSSEATWMVGSDATALASASNFDSMQEVTAEGTTAVHVDDAAEIRGYDVDVRIALRKARSADNRPLDKRGTVRMRQTDVAPGDLLRWRGDAMLGEKTGDYDMLEALGVRPVEFHAAFKQRLTSTYGRARTEWRAGRCIEVVPARGFAGGPLAGSATVSLGPDARHRIDGTTVTTARLDAVPLNGTIAPPFNGVPHPAIFRFTMPAFGGARVAVTATSRRGIGFGDIIITQGPAGDGTIDYDATASYTVNGVDEYGQSVSGGLATSEHVATTFRLEFDRQSSDGSRYYRVLAENRITVDGQGEITGKRGGHTVTVATSLDGQGTSHNPLGAGDAPLVTGYMRAPEQRQPSSDAGQMRFYTRNGQRMYELRLNIAQIVPSFTFSRRSRIECPASIGGAGVVTTTYSNATRATTVAIDDPAKCHGHYGNSFTSSAPYTYGVISTDWTRTDSVSGSNAMVTGRYDPAATARVVTGQKAGSFNTCERVLLFDPTQLGAYTRTLSGFPVGWPVHQLGVCQMSYAIRWSIPLPADMP